MKWISGQGCEGLCATSAVLAFIFIINVYGTLAMPEFSGTLLGLMGISSGTYLGFKAPEKKKVSLTQP